MPISFLILTYNSSSYIYSFLDSLFEKIESGLKNDKYELIIVDNDSTDNTVRKINSYLEKKNKKNISFVRNKQNAGSAR
jgi:glycosyltransferase involved in cell wall biosynthesis